MLANNNKTWQRSWKQAEVISEVAYFKNFLGEDGSSPLVWVCYTHARVCQVHVGQTTD